MHTDDQDELVDAVLDAYVHDQLRAAVARYARYHAEWLRDFEPAGFTESDRHLLSTGHKLAQGCCRSSEASR
jgi:hypothetical protein